MALSGGQAAIAATATSITTALGLTERKFCRQIDVKNAALALNNLYIGATNTVTNVPAFAIAELVPGQAWSDVAVGSNHVNTDNVFLVGTVNAANIAFITLVD